MDYNICSVCKLWIDDGGFKNGQFVCHKCLDWINKMEESIKQAEEKCCS